MGLQPQVTDLAPQTSISVADELIKLAALKDQGILSPEEFNDQKRKLLGIPRTEDAAPEFESSTIQSTDANPNADAAREEAIASSAFEDARECLTNGQKEMAIDILKDIIRRFPNTKAASRAQKSLTPKPKG